MSTTFFVRPLNWGAEGEPACVVELPTHRSAREHASASAKVTGEVWVVVRKNRGTQIVDVHGPVHKIPVGHLHDKHRPPTAFDVDGATS